MHTHKRATSRDWMGLIGPLLGQGWAPYQLTFMFHPMGGNQMSVQAQQRRAVEEVYGRLVARAVRKPCAPSALGRLPILIGCPDFPVYKHAKMPMREVTINDGQHFHAYLIWPREDRLKTDLESHIEQNERLYVPPDGALCRLHCVPIIYDHEYVCGYVTKSWTRGRVDYDALVVLPRARSEMRDISAPVGRNSSIFGSRSD